MALVARGRGYMGRFVELHVPNAVPNGSIVKSVKKTSALQQTKICKGDSVERHMTQHHCIYTPNSAEQRDQPEHGLHSINSNRRTDLLVVIASVDLAIKRIKFPTVSDFFTPMLSMANPAMNPYTEIRAPITP